jgi:hypothetical protein
MRHVRGQIVLTNANLMTPFCRRVAEDERVLRAMAAQGLERGWRRNTRYAMASSVAGQDSATLRSTMAQSINLYRPCLPMSGNDKRGG